MMNSTQSPSADYYLDRYEAGSDRWTRLKETDKLADAQKTTMRIPGLRAYNAVGFTKRRAS